MNKRYLQFQKILDLSKTMLECAVNSAWDDLTKAESCRQELINLFFDSPIDISEADWLESAIHELLSIDKQTVEKGKNELESIFGNMQQLKKGKQGADAYQKNL